jgi:YgiT-type zinc finger domain-containing protein
MLHSPFGIARVIVHSAQDQEKEVNKKQSKKLCPLCAGTKKTGTTTFTANLEFGVVVVRKVPATVCSQCGADWIDDRVAKHLENIVNNARKKRLQVEVTSFS